MRAFLVAGSPQAGQPAGIAPEADDYVVAVDSGWLHTQAWGWPVDLLIGDLDSLPPEAAALARATVPDVITAPPAKDETDLELALAQALARGAREIIICAALGGRPDHMLANILLLARPDLRDVNTVIVEGRESLRLLRGGEALTVAGAAGDLLSLLPLGDEAVGVATGGLEYPLHRETLYPGQARGISNVFTAAGARVTLEKGTLLVYHGR